MTRRRRALFLGLCFFWDICSSLHCKLFRTSGNFNIGHDGHHCVSGMFLFTLQQKQMVLWIIIVSLVLLVVGVLFIPIRIFVDTAHASYYVSFKGLARASLEPDQKELFRIRLKVFFLEHFFYPLRKSTKPKKIGNRPARKKRRMNARTMLRLARSFKVQKLSLDMDTGDYVVNAKLYPVFMLLDRHVGSFHINFEDRNRLVMDVRNTPYRLIKSFINH